MAQIAYKKFKCEYKIKVKGVILLPKENHEKILESIKKKIITQHYKPGEHLGENTLANDFNVSRTIIREVLKRLETEEFVEYKPYKGSYIKKFSAHELKNLFELRMALDSLAVKLFCNSSTKDKVDELREILHNSSKAVEETNIEEYVTYDARFHSFITYHSNNNELYETIEKVNQKIYRFRVVVLNLPDQLEKSYQEHRKIVDHLELGNCNEAYDKAWFHAKKALDNFEAFSKIYTPV